MSKKINRALLQDILSKGDGVKTISSEAVDWCIAVAETAAKNLAKSGRRTPGGRLMAPKFAPSLMARQAALPSEPALGEGDCVVQEAISPPGSPEWTEFNDWQAAVRRKETKLPFEEWKKEKAK